MARRRWNAGFNLVEIMITLTLVALLTTTLITFVNDFEDKTKIARARADMMRLGQQALLAESQMGQQISTASAGSSEVVTMLLDWIVEMPPVDPWGNRFVVSADGTAVRSSTQGTAYVLDPSYGRFLCAGPDGLVQTRLGSKLSDFDNDIVVEFRQQPWVAFSFTPTGSTDGRIWVSRADGTALAQVFPHPSYMGGGMGVSGVSFSPDGSRWVGLETDGSGSATAYLVAGFCDAENPRILRLPAGGYDENGVFNAGFTGMPNINTAPFFTPDGTQVVYIAPTGAIVIWNLISNEKRLLVPFGAFLAPNLGSYPDSTGRIIHVSRQRSYYWHPGYASQYDETQAIAVAPDGKIAVGLYQAPHAGREGIYVLLPGGQGQRRIKDGTGDVWLPLFWIDSENLIYYAIIGSNIHFRRISQNGTFDIPLFNATATGSKITGLEPRLPAISPDGSLLAFVHTAAFDGKILFTNGAGYLKGDPVQTNFQFPTPPITHQEFLFSADGGSMFAARQHGGSPGSGITEIHFRRDQPGLAPLVRTPLFNDTFESTPARMALSPNGTMIATVSAPAPIPVPPRQGVLVFPLLGPHGAAMTISTTQPLYNPRNHPNIAWIEN